MKTRRTFLQRRVLFEVLNEGSFFTLALSEKPFNFSGQAYLFFAGLAATYSSAS
jgi:hypothetical protein